MELLEIKGAMALLDIGDYTLRVEALTQRMVRCTYERAREGGRSDSPLGITPPGTKPEPAAQWAQEAGALVLRTASITLAVDLAIGRLEWSDGTGRAYVAQPAPALSDQPVVRYTTGGEAPIIRRVKTVDGERNFVENLRPVEDRTALRAKVFFDWSEDEAIHGLGQGEEGIFNYRGTVQYLYQHNMRIPVPFLLSDCGYGVLFDCGSLMTFNDDARGSYVFLDTVDRLDFYFLAGSADEVISGMRQLTGRASLPPKWAFGYIQSKEAYATQQELVEVAEEYRRRHIPLDCVVQDWHTWEADQWGNKRVDRARYPDLAAAQVRVHELQVHTMVSIWPNMKPGCEDHEEFVKAGLLLGDASTYDAFCPEARALYWKQADRELFSGGFDSWWCDSTEPFSGPDWGGAVLREPWERYYLVGGEHKKYLDPAVANLYSLRHAQGIYENQRSAAPKKRVLNLTRSGSAGSQKYGAVLWSGDISASWDTLKRQIAEGLNLCMSGLPWWTLDVGGFFTVRENWRGRGCGCNTDPSPLWFWNGDYEQGIDDPTYRELYVRWLQLGTFLPMLRSHGTDTPREIWHFGEPGTPYYDTIELFIRLRYTLMPYLYSIAGRTALEDYTMLRALLFDFGDDETARSISDQFMFGDAILVCPVTEPLAQKRTCYLPRGSWTDFWTGECLEGGRFVEVATPLEQIPLFVRAGSIVPMETAKLEYACQQTGEPIELRVYPGADGSFQLYEDSGDGYGYEAGEYNRIALRWQDRTRTFTVGAANRDFPQSIRGRQCVVRVGDSAQTFTYHGEPVTITFEQEGAVF